MKATECLNTEHGVFLVQLDFLEDLLKKSSPNEVLRGVVLTIARAVEQHADVEEKILYPAILRAFDKDFPPIKQMEFEHGELNQLIQQIERGSEKTSQLAAQFIDLLKSHIMKEIQVLFPLCDSQLSGPELEEMSHQCVKSHHDKNRTVGGGCCHAKK